MSALPGWHEEPWPDGELVAEEVFEDVHGDPVILGVDTGRVALFVADRGDLTAALLSPLAAERLHGHLGAVLEGLRARGLL